MKSRRGFASMSPERRREIARLGGLKSQQSGKGHRFTHEEAKAAGKLGGDLIAHDREHMAAIGQLGGLKTSVDREHMRKIGKRGGHSVSYNREHMREIGKLGNQAQK